MRSHESLTGLISGTAFSRTTFWHHLLLRIMWQRLKGKGCHTPYRNVGGVLILRPLSPLLDITQTDTPTIRLGAIPSGLTNANLHHPPIFFTGRMPFLPPNQQCQSTEGN